MVFRACYLCLWTVAFALGAAHHLHAASADDQSPAGLATLVREAIARNLSIEQERLSPAIAAANIQAAKGTFDPRIEFGPQLGRNSQSAVTTAGSPAAGSQWASTLTGGAGGLLPYSAASVVGNLPTGTQYGASFRSQRLSQDSLISQRNPVEVNSSLTISVAHPLLRGAGTSISRGEIRAAEIGERAIRAGFGRFTEETIGQVEQAYWSLALARGLEASAQESLRRAVTLLERNEELRRLELATDVDVLSGRQGVAARRESVVAARARREDFADALVFLVYGREAVAHLADVVAVETAPLPESASISALDEVESEALGARRDLAAARLQVDRSRVNLEVARSGLRSGLYLTGSYSATTQQADSLRLFGVDGQGFASAGWTAGLQYTLPVGNNLAKAVFLQASHTEQQRNVAVVAVENQIRADVRASIRAIQAGEERVALATEALSLAVAQYDAENERLRLGLSDTFRLLQFDETVAQAQIQQLQARFSLAQALVAYDLARGYSAAKYGIGESK